jgi:hypothetical protein
MPCGIGSRRTIRTVQDLFLRRGDNLASTSSNTGTFTLRAHQGDAKTLLAFNLDKQNTKNLAGFTIQCQPDGQQPYFIHNQLQFQLPGNHAQDAAEPANSSINAPIHKFRWLHVPGSVHQGLKPFFGKYTYTVTPRYFDDHQSMQPIDPTLSAAVNIDVVPFKKDGLELGFTRGFVQSQAFVHHFGLKAAMQPSPRQLLFDTSLKSGVNAAGQSYTFQDEYEWLGFTAREKIFGVLNEVLTNANLNLDMFAYDLNEPDVLQMLLQLAGQGRIRLILDNAKLHHDSTSSTPEDQFEVLFTQTAKGNAAILRGKFNRFAHDKVLIVSDGGGPVKVLTGSTNFSITGVYVNANHVLVFNDPTVAAQYSAVFQSVFAAGAKPGAFQKTPLAGQEFSFSSNATPQTEITFAPHLPAFSDTVLNKLTDRVGKEGKQGTTTGSVLFAVMQLDKGTGPVFPALTKLHEDQTIFSFGISDSPQGIFLYTPGQKTGVLVTGRPTSTKLPPPFDQVPGVGIGHQIHHKFVVCGFNSADPVVYCGSSNLASGGEEENGDNLLAIHDSDVATAFAIEALGLVDHFNFLDRFAKAPDAPKNAQLSPPALKVQAAASAGWFLGTTDKWVAPYFNPNDLHSIDRQIFA